MKGIGEGAAHHLIAERAKKAFDSLFDLCARIDTRTVNKRVIDSLIKVGALDSLHANRRALSEAVDRAFDRGSRLAKNKADNQETLFASFDRDDSFRADTQGYPAVDDFPPRERLAFERALTGHWISSHPLSEHQATCEPFATATSRDLPRLATGSRATIAAVVLDKRVIRTKTGKAMAILQLEDAHGRFEGVLFPASGRRGAAEVGPFDQFAADCADDLVALFTGTVERRGRGNRGRPQVVVDDDAAPSDLDAVDDGPIKDAEAPEEVPSLIISDMIPVDLVCERLTQGIVLAIDAARQGALELAATEALFKEHQGQCPVRVEVHTPLDIALTVALGDRWRVHPNRELVRALRAIWGERQVRLIVRADPQAAARARTSAA